MTEMSDKNLCDRCGRRVPVGTPPCETEIEHGAQYRLIGVEWLEDGRKVRSQLPEPCLKRVTN